MDSPTPRHRPVPRGSFLLLQDEPPLAPMGHGALASLIRHRGREEEEGLGEGTEDELPHRDERRMSAILNSSHMRTMRLIGNSNPRYRWEQYWKTDEELVSLPKHLRKYHERVNYLVQQYLYIDRLLDSSLPHDLLNEYNNMPASAFRGVEVPATIAENSTALEEPPRKVLRTPQSHLPPHRNHPFVLIPRRAIGGEDEDEDDLEAGRPKPEIPWLEDDVVDSDAPIVTFAIYVNFAANAILLAGKIAVIISVPSVSVLASLVDALLDFLSTVIVWLTTWLIRKQDQYRYPVGRRRLEPLVAAIAIMLGTIVIKGLYVIFNAGSIAFPINALGGLLLSLVVIFNWSQTSFEHIRHLSGFSATADQRNILLYLTMRFAKTIKQIQGLQAYHAGDKLIVEVDIVLDASTPLKDSHDLSESLQYVLESVPIVDRAFVHVDYATYNLPTHMEQQTA
ncbi:hypothetical protein N0V88_004479 [Collariella sp. IMI 366227]|nr:hypothetical protein N0V88_004479 [Collariella sp. IMI 366227]